MQEVVDALHATIAELTATIRQQAASMEKMQGEIAELRRLLFGPHSERVVPIEKEHQKKKRNKSPSPRSRQLSDPARKRKKPDDTEAKRVELPVEDIHHRLTECPECDSKDLEAIGKPERSDEIAFVPAHFVRRRHHREKKRCNGCGKIHTAPGPAKVIDGGKYGASTYANIVVSKCADSMPFHRQAKQLERFSVPINRSVLCNLFHRAADLITPIYRRMMTLIAEADHVHAGETPHLVQAPGKCKRGYVWTFVANAIIAYVFSPSRSGETPRMLLGDTKGTLQVDGYSGYNTVIVPEGRKRAGCHGHSRRKFFDALPDHPKEARTALDFILELYEVEYEAARLEILGTARHLALRRARMEPVFESYKAWLDEQKESARPSSQLGKAVGYALNQWKTLTLVLEDVNVALDNNIAESAMRIIAMGRKNFVFFGNNDAGQNLAMLQTLVSTCIANGVNPQAYLEDVLIRIESTPASRIDELLPQNWSKAA